ncbi:hypothetical protein PTKIN_Ptkin01aG0079500 [Pterospermum kingtungense]
MVLVSNGTKVRVMYQYERLPDFCFACGKLDHIELECELAIRQKREEGSVKRDFSPWMRADGCKLRSMQGDKAKHGREEDDRRTESLVQDERIQMASKSQLVGGRQLVSSGNQLMETGGVAEKGMVVTEGEEGGVRGLLKSVVTKKLGFEIGTSQVVSKSPDNSELSPLLLSSKRGDHREENELSMDVDPVSKKAWLGAPRAVQEMTRLVRIKRPSLLFLMETKRNNREMEWLRVRWGFDSCLTVESVGRAGGVALLWNDEVDVRIMSYSLHHIDARVESPKNRKVWWFKASMAILVQQKGKSLGSCYVIFIVNLVCLGFILCRGSDENAIFERLDRSVANEEWFNMFPYSIENRPMVSSSDHLPLILCISDQPERAPSSGRGFRFENMWVANSHCEEIIAESWNNESLDLVTKIRRCKKALKKWNHREFMHIKKRICQKTKDFELLYTEGQEKRDEGGGNTAYFHRVASKRRANNLIKGIKSASGKWKLEENDIVQEFIDYYNMLFASTNPDTVDAILRLIQRRVTSAMNNELDVAF